VGAVVARLDDGFTGAVLDALARELARSDVSFIAAVADGTPETTEARIAELVRRGAGAVAFCGAAVPGVTEIHASSPGVPFVSLDGSGVPDARWAPVFSRAQALALGVLYLGDLGHVKVALLDVPDSATAESVKQRGAARGIEVVTNFENGLARGLTLDEMASGLSQNPRITGAVCGSDSMAVALLRACAYSQIAVPGELAVIGFGDSDLSRHVRPGLTSLRIAPTEAGVALAHRTIDALAGRVVDTAPLTAKLVARDSAALRMRLPDA
jgi:LacI family transcriptional regulator